MDFTESNYSKLFESEAGSDVGPQIPPEFAWHSMFNRLAKDDITKFEEVEQINYITALNQLSLWYYQAKIQEWHHKQQMRKR